MARAPKTTTSARATIDAVRHRDKRANIPTEELREFVADDERAPKTLLYPRDPSLDPQLVWKGKDEQDSADLEVQAVPIYIQEKIDPHAIIEDLRRGTRDEGRGASADGQQLDLFASFDGEIAFDELVDFYHHEQNWSNRLILGDSLLVMASLAEKEGLKGKVQTIYLDPPYGIRFGSNWQVSTRKRDVKDGKAEDLTRQPEQIKAFRDTWQLGIHSYLAYLRERLVVARELLTESGSIFVQIGDENVHLVRCLLDEVFGSENFCGAITFSKTAGASSQLLAGITDTLLWYATNKERVKYRQVFLPKQSVDEGAGEYKYLLYPNGSTRSMTSAELSAPWSLPDDAVRYRPSATTSQRPPGSDPFDYRGRIYRPGRSQYWKTHIEGLRRLGIAGRLIPRGESVSYLRQLNDFPVAPVTNLWMDTRWGFDASEKRYVVETNTKAVARCILMTTDPGDLVLDPTCGSGTSAFVAEQWGRRWITIDTSRVALALARTRLMTARYPYYLLADSDEGRAKEREVGGTTLWPGSGQGDAGRGTSKLGAAAPAGDIRRGFVYRRVPHITLKSIANNPEIDAIHAAYQQQLEPRRARLNALTGQQWEEWEIPREVAAGWPSPAENVHADWWRLRRERQRDIDAAIARHAESETLYDQPYEDNKRVRVAGPFTVESLSPHRVLAAGDESESDERPASEDEGRRDAALAHDGFETTVLEHLRRAGIQNTVRDERLAFERLEPYAGEYLHALGEYTTKNDLAKRVAISIGPEHGTVGADWVREAAKEALRGAGFDMLVILAMAWDAGAGETADEFRPKVDGKGPGFLGEEERQYGKLPLLLARMNPDLLMGDLLKSTGAGNLFMVFGEPDVDIRTLAEHVLQVEIRGLDVYDPTTGVIRSSSTDDIACWFIDTDYNEESFFVRHAYFTGADQPYDKLKRALRAEIDEAAWAELYTTTSRPFPRPQHGRIALKVINHYGDEVLKVYRV